MGMGSSFESTMKVLRQFLLLVWKGLILRRRHFIVTGFEIILPLLFIAIFVYVRTLIGPITYRPSQEGEGVNQDVESPATYYEPFEPLTRVGYIAKYKLYYTPNNTMSSALIQKMIEKLANGVESVPEFELLPAMSEEHLEVLLYNDTMNDNDDRGVTYSIAIVFNNIKNDAHLPISLDYKLRLEGYFSTVLKYRPFNTIGPAYNDVYRNYHFYVYQTAVDMSFIDLKIEERKANKSSKQIPKLPQVMMQRFPYPPYKQNTNAMTFFLAIPFVIIYGFILTCLIFVKRIVDEKANRAKEMMKMMGLNDLVYWFGTFTNNFVLMVGICTIAAILFKIKFANNTAIIDYSDGFLFWIVLFMYTAAALLFCMAITTVFNKSVVAVIVTLVLWCVSHVVPMVLMNKDPQSVSLGQKLASCLLPNMALHWACQIMGKHEATGAGAHWGNINKAGNVDDSFSLSMVLGMLVVCCGIYSTIIWYLDNVWPWQYGMPLPFYYPFLPSYWRGKCTKEGDYEDEDIVVKPSKYFEAESPEDNPGVILKNLTKIFGWGSSSKLAVNDVSLKIFSGQITALLGHNGAGKTTMMHMITGLYPPTSGTVLVNGFDIRYATRKARGNLGLCPQHNVLYDSLTVEEHLVLFAGLKGLPFARIGDEVRRTINFLELQTKTKELSRTLSGGMKRKLSLGMAMIGGSQVLILDEPTSGMDPQARRSVWDMLQELRKQKTILLTTHYMEEADVLGDRIAIMADGTIQCYGTPIFLKKMFGTGYHLRLVKSSGFDLMKVITTIERHIPGVHVDNEINTEITLVLNAESSEPFADLFDELEKRRNELGIVGSGLSITTMEDVFLKVGQLAEQGDLGYHDGSNGHENGALLHHNGSGDDVLLRMSIPKKLEGLLLLVQIIKGLLLKRLHDARRGRAYYIFQLILPIILMSCLAYLHQNLLSTAAEKTTPLPLNLAKTYGATTGVYAVSGRTPLIDIYDKVLKKGGAKPLLVKGDLNSYLVDVGTGKLVNYRSEYLVGGTINMSTNPRVVTAWYNAEALHVGPISLNLMHTTLLSYVTDNEDATITTTNSPLVSRYARRVTFENRPEDFILTRIIFAIFVPISLSFLSSSYVLFPIHERVTKSKLLQMMTGLNGIFFWVSHFAWDFSAYIFCSVLLLLPFAALDTYGLYTGTTDAFGAMYLLLLMYGWSSIPMSYLISCLPFIKTPSGGFTILTIISIFSGMILATVMTVVSYIPTAKTAVKVLVWLFRFLPYFSVTWGMTNIQSIAQKNSACTRVSAIQLKYLCPTLTPENPIFPCCPDHCGDYCFHKKPYLNFDTTSAGPDVFFMFLTGGMAFCLLLLLETNLVKLWYDLKKKLDFGSKPMEITDLSGQLVEDSDVTAERLRVEELLRRGSPNSETLVVLNLSKRFSNMYAVDHLTFAIHKKECFGFLGINGAGKTTTFSMLTGDLMIDDGNAFIETYSVKDDLHRFQQHIGYCPQFDALLDQVSGREALFFFARLRGIPEDDIEQEVSRLVSMVDLQAHADKIAAQYSGGNRRKLSLALALIGAPPVVFLDEPTAGIDPAARRKIWGALMAAKRTGVMSFILTTHSMEECEALCSRLAIMVNGKFRCMGATQHLKTKFGEGYTVMIKLNKAQSHNTEAVTRVRQFVEEKFPLSSLKDIHQGTLTYHILDNTITWSQLFRTMEMAKRTFTLEDYLVSDTTLEQIFLTFARNQRVVAS